MQSIIRVSSLTSLTAFLAAAIATATGCDVATDGAQGQIRFTPDECGRFAGCDFMYPIGVGGSLLVHISGIDGVSTVGLDLEPSDPELLAISAVGDVGGQPTWQVIGLAPGPVSILAVDDNREAVDYLDVEVLQPSKLTLENIIGEAVGPLDDLPEYDEHWIIENNQRALFHVLATREDATPVMGQYDYAVTVSPDLIAGINDPEILALGRLDITPTTPGPYDVQFDATAGYSLSVLLDVQDTP